MQSLLAFYQGRVDDFNERLSYIKGQLFVSSMLRLVVFIGTVVAIYLFFGNTRAVLAIVIMGTALFLFLVSRHTDMHYERDKFNALVKINQIEIEVLNRNYQHLPEGNEYKDPLHFFSQDIDLFGRGSFYQYSNRTALLQGSDRLAFMLKENGIENILEKQGAIQELSKMPEWRQDFSAVASLTNTTTDTASILKWLANYKPFVPKIMTWLPRAFSLVSVVLAVLYFLGLLSGAIFLLWFLLGFVVSGTYMKKITKLGAAAGKIQSTFSQYNKLLTNIEEGAFNSVLLKEKKGEIISKGKKTSSVLRAFSDLLNALDQNNNIFYLMVGNGLFLRALATSQGIEKWIAEYGESVESWFNTVAFFDAFNSLGNFAFNHPGYAFPVVIDEGSVLRSKEAGHPLLQPEKSVLNDFQIDNEQFFIVTGANMAGKSTFLRTVSLQIVMANMGLPVCAKEVSYSPIKLITSMRTTDSLTDDESYFFSELKRLKFIVDEIQKDRYFIVLDEILKGTNSTDKAKGSRKFVEKLVGSSATGIIATHDLSLCEAAKELPQIKNYYFDAEIIDDELHFDYKFKNGICQNMNASFLLKKMGIVN